MPEARIFRWKFLRSDENVQFEMHGPVLKRVRIEPDNDYKFKPRLGGLNSFEHDYDYEEDSFYKELAEDIARCRDFDGNFFADPFLICNPDTLDLC